jgi:hypothetical protein
VTEATSGEDWADGRDVVFTPGRGYRAPLRRRGAISLVVAGIAAALASGRFFGPLAWSIAAVFGTTGLVYAARYVWTRRFSTRLSADGIRARGYFDHFIPWSEVAGLDVGGSAAADGKQNLIAGKPWDSPVGVPGGTAGLVGRSDGGRAKLATVRVLRSTGRPTLLRAPLVTPWQSDPQFEEKARLIRQYWQTYGAREARQLPG